MGRNVSLSRQNFTKWLCCALLLPGLTNQVYAFQIKGDMCRDLVELNMRSRSLVSRKEIDGSQG